MGSVSRRSYRLEETERLAQLAMAASVVSFETSQLRVLEVHEGTPRLRSRVVDDLDRSVEVCVGGSPSFPGVRQSSGPTPRDQRTALEDRRLATYGNGDRVFGSSRRRVAISSAEIRQRQKGEQISFLELPHDVLAGDADGQLTGCG